jgi:prepilin-type N-terminal cleavage/methylation domain-containing protein
MKLNKKAYTLVEILIVVTILSIIFIVGYRAMRAVSYEAVQLNRAAASTRKAEFDRFVGILNDRLGQAWSYNLVSIPNGSQLQLLNAAGVNYAQFTLTSPDLLTFNYELADIGTNYTANPLSILYNYTNQEPSTNVLMQQVIAPPIVGFTTAVAVNSGVSVNWQIPPPLYYDADIGAFTGLFLADNNTDFTNQVEEQRTNHTGLLQHDLKSYNWNPGKQAFR